MQNDIICSIKDLNVYFPIKSGLLQKTVGYIKAVDGVSIDIRRGETLGLVGESGCGKTTLGRAIVKLNQPTAGDIIYNGIDLVHGDPKEIEEASNKLQIIFQDPYSSLNPRQTVRRMLTEVLTVKMGMSEKDALEESNHLLMQVGLSTQYGPRYPHEFSGGQRQRVAIARAIATRPEFLVCDEAVSALDVSIQSQIINLLMDLKEEMGDVTYLFISHALNVIEHISDRVAVMYLGKIVELAETAELYDNPAHPYTKALLSAIPMLAGREERELIELVGEVPSAGSVPSGCRFHTRCPYATDRCSEEEPQFKEIAPGHFAACHLV